MKTQLALTWLALVWGTANLQAQTGSTDPLRNSNGEKAAEVRGEEDQESEEAGSRPNLTLRYEVISLGLTDAAAVLDGNPGDAEVYQKLKAMIAKKGAKLETLTVMRVQSGTQAVAMSSLTTSAPTEYQAPVSGEGEHAKLSIIPPLPTAFESWNIGDSMEVQATLDEPEAVVSLQISPKRLEKVGISSWGQDLARTDMIDLGEQSLQTMVQLPLGKVSLLGTINRSHALEQKSEDGPRVWYAFVTVNLAKP